MAIETFMSLARVGGVDPPPVPRMRASAYGTDPQPAYDAAGTGNRLRAWNPSSAAVDALLSASGDDLRRKVHQLVRNNAWASNAIDSFVGEAIGTGVTPNSLHPDPQIKAAIEAAWLRWTDEADASGRCDFYGLESMVVRAMMEGGECFARLRPRRKADGLSVPLQLQVLESEHLPTNKTEPVAGSLNRIRYGIEYDAIGKRAAYHLYREHPGSSFAAGELTRVPSWEYDSVKGALHIYRPLRLGQERGQPWFVPILLKLRELDQMDDATLSKQKVLAFFALFIKKMSKEGAGVMNEVPDENGIGTAEMEPNTLQYLNDDEEVQEVGGKGPGGEYDMFVRGHLRAISAVFLGMPYYLLTGDLSDVNFSSIRAGMLAFRRKLEQFIHQVVVFQFCRPVWKSWLDAAVLSGALNLPGYEQDPTPYLAVEWTPQAWPWVDPVKDVESKQMEIRAGLTSRSAAVAERGGSRITVDKQQSEDNASADAAGVKYDSDGRTPKNGGTPPAEGANGKQNQPPGSAD